MACLRSCRVLPKPTSGSNPKLFSSRSYLLLSAEGQPSLVQPSISLYFCDPLEVTIFFQCSKILQKLGHFHHIPQNGQGARGHCTLASIRLVISETRSGKAQKDKVLQWIYGASHIAVWAGNSASHPENQLSYFTPEMTRRA